MGLRPDLTLVDQAFFRFVHKFDRVFDGQNMGVLVFVDVIDHCRQCRRFSRPRRPGDQYNAARIFGNILEYPGAVEFFERHHLGWNGPEHRPRSAVLHKSVDPETRQIRDFKGKVALEMLFVSFALRIAHDVIDHRVHFFVRHGRQVDAAHIAMYADHRRQPGRKVQVGGLVLDAEGQQLSNVHRFCPR